MFRERAHGSEFLDRPDADPRLVEQGYKFMKVVNRLGGGIRVVRKFLEQELAQSGDTDGPTVLDIGAGAGDIPLALTRWADTHGYKLRFTCLDHDPKAVELAQNRIARCHCRTIEAVQADVFTYQPADQFDYALGSMTFHHFTDEEIDALLTHLRAFTSVLDLMGMGCGGAIPNLEAAGRMIQSGARKTVLCLSVEICSATFFLGPDPDLVVSNSIFADGASAAIVQAGDDRPQAGGASGPQLPASSLLSFIDFESATLPRYREQLRYTSQGGRLRNVLTRNVPAIGARAVAQVVRRLLDRHGLTQEAIDWWIVHPGGTQVLNAVQRQIGLAPEKLRFSYEVFRNYGNMSSPSVLFVLDRIRREAQPKSGDTGLLLSFGAGFTAFAALVEFL